MEEEAAVEKAPDAFRTISEVAADLNVPQHVLRFWESRFREIKPMKRGGGRRYYRPDDIALLRRISALLYVQGYTIKGVQRLLRESGGKLSDNIPPPTPDEQAEAAEEHAIAWDFPAGKGRKRVTVPRAVTQSSIKVFAVSPDGKTLALGLEDGSARLYDLAGDAFTGGVR